MKCKISIVTVVYNGEKTLASTIDSVCNQSLKPYEYIIVDGCSTDNSLSIARKYQKRFPFIKIVSEKDNGIYDAMNKGITLSSGNIIGIINSDDWLEEDALQEISLAFLESGNAIYYGYIRMVENEVESLVERGNHNFLFRKMIPHPTCFVPKLFYEKYGAFNLNYKSAADYDLMLRFFYLGLPFIPINKIITNFRLGGMSSTIVGALEVLKIRRKYRLLSRKDFFLKMISIRVTNILKKSFTYKNK